MAAFSVVEVLFVIGLVATVASTAALEGRAAVTHMRTASAGRFLLALLQDVRTRAIERGCDTALRVRRDDSGYSLLLYEDGNRNGVLSADIASGVDAQVGPRVRLPERFPGVDFGAEPGLPGVDGSPAPGNDPVRLGTSDGVTFSPSGTTSTGSLYVRGPGGLQYVVRIFGETGRVRVLKFHSATRRWLPL